MDLVRSAEAAGPAGQPVKFQSSLEAATYCEERLREGWLVASDSSGADKGASRTRLSHPGLDKERMFHQEGKSLVQLLASGVAELDSRLNTVRLDRFGNVMIWEAPEWSPASAQFTHGFPRRMIEAAHGGFLPGNIVVTAKASNLSIRRMTVCDVASLVSRVAIAGSGLSVGHLSNLRYAAARYRRCGSYLPDYLIRGMLEFGVNFLSFQAVEPDTLEALSKTVGKAWAHAEQEDGDDEDESMASGSLPDDVLSSLGHRPTPEGAASVPTVERDQALSMIRSNSVAERLGGDGEVQERVLEVQRPGDQAAPKRKRRKGSSSGGRAKKPNTPAVVNDSGGE
ncbi:hypothetical protein OS493_006619 [Desmophyllum pertusum]|uniref:Uncharacterized protein n=1 Tax=Desmophyllum pertusum TaxID=174260 RepID=A0A9X0A588_9CNID|nr:hypothetical protein OS493_006619 [Desmophyllum pertusum]